MKKYEILEHRADLKIKVWAKDRQELFCNALKAAFEAIEPNIVGAGTRVRKIRAASEDENSLLIDFLNEAIYLSDVNNETYIDVKFESFARHGLAAELVARPVKGFKQEIKAVTHHGFKIEKTEKGLEADIIFDI
ncbi:archease [Patescibacteria group bacterium]|nr:archease [Patescibacteria group bacterium]MBU1921622.1 archease [Patescibacteria group bacterium]